MNSIEVALSALKQGKMIVVVDDESRENEGDLICAAASVTEQQVNFMSRYGRGLICLALPPQQVQQLDLPLMQRKGGSVDALKTAFTYSIDAQEGITTGISAADRAFTIRLAVNPNTTPVELCVPGHVFPLQAKAGGVLQRRGHTEAAVDLTQLAGLTPGGVICEIMHENGTMMRFNDLTVFAKQHGMPLISIQQLIDYRLQHELKSVCQVPLPTPSATFNQRIYQDAQGKEHMLLWLGNLPQDCVDAPLVRIHSECLTGDVFQSLRCDCGRQLQQALTLITAEACGLVIYLRQEGRGIGLAEKIKAYALQDQGLDTVEANYALGHAADMRSYEIAVKMLQDLGLSKIRLLTNNPAKAEYLVQNGIQVERVSLVIAPGPHNLVYQRTKAVKLGHLIPISQLANLEAHNCEL